MAENKVQDTQNVEIFRLPDSYSMSGSFRFGIKNHGESFKQITKRFDVFIIELRNKAIKKIASEMKMDVKWVD